MNLIGEKIQGTVDYIHCPWIISAAASVSVAETT
jgi:hypothetical protein